MEINSPADLAGLSPEKDYLLGTAEKVRWLNLRSIDDLNRGLRRGMTIVNLPFMQPALWFKAFIKSVNLLHFYLPHSYRCSAIRMSFMRNSQLIWRHPLSFMYIMPTVTRYLSTFSKSMTHLDYFVDFLQLFSLTKTTPVLFAAITGPYSRSHALGSMGWKRSLRCKCD